MQQQRGRPRDDTLDAAILEATRRHLARHGYEAMSLVAVAAEAGTTRQALYRRWPTKAALARAAIAPMADREPDPGGDDPFHDLVAELQSFQRGVSRGSRMSLVGTMLQDTTDAGLRARYRQDVIAPRRRRLRAMLERARQAGAIDGDADLEVAVTMLTGSWYARALAGEPIPERWPERAVALVWRALGGTVPA